jgi:hypothetical protein
MTGLTAVAGRGIRADTLAYTILVQLGLLILTVFIVILKPSNPEDPAFEGKKTVRLPQREFEHRVAVAEFQQLATSPLRIERLSTSALLPDGLPPMANFPRSEFNPMESTEFLTSNTDALLAHAGLDGALDRIKSAVSAAAFFGVENQGKRIVIVVNTSASVMRKAAKSRVYNRAHSGRGAAPDRWSRFRNPVWHRPVQSGCVEICVFCCTDHSIQSGSRVSVDTFKLKRKSHDRARTVLLRV